MGERFLASVARTRTGPPNSQQSARASDQREALMEDLANFARLVDAIRSWLTHVVIVGGWVHRLHRFHPLATAQEYQPLRTRNVDLAFSPGEDNISAPARYYWTFNGLALFEWQYGGMRFL